MKICLLILVAITVAYCLPADIYKTEWEKFKLKFNKHYSSEEEEFRFKLFCDSLDSVTKHNEDYDKGKTSFTMGINQFSDLTPEEKRRWLGTHHPQEIEEVKNSHLPVNAYETEWEKFKVKFNKHYSPEEEEFRFELFCDSLDSVTKHNEDYDKGKTSFKMGINQFSDLTPEEKKNWLGTRHPHGTQELENSHLSDDIYKKEWEHFKLKFNKQYSLEEEEFRFKLFCDSLDLVTKHNEDYDKGKTSFKMGINQFSDLTPEERKRWLGTRYTQEVEEVKNSYLPDSVYETEWEKFKETYKKLYDSLENENRRFQIFCDNLDKIYRHNELYNKGLVSDKMGVNKFADLTQEEFKKMLGLKPVREGMIDLNNEFEAFKARFNKNYATSAEEEHRFGVFSKNMAEIAKHNQDYENGLTSFKMGVTMFTDMTHEEYIDWLKEEAGHHTWAPPHH